MGKDEVLRDEMRCMYYNGCNAAEKTCHPYDGQVSFRGEGGTIRLSPCMSYVPKGGRLERFSS